MEKNLVDLSKEELIEFVGKQSASIVAKDNEIIEKNNQLAAKEKEITSGVFENKKLKTELDAANNINSQYASKIDELSKEVPEEKRVNLPGVSKETFELDGIKYRFVFSKINTKDGPITAVEVLASKDLQKELVDIGSGMIKAI